jgi:hypothetical protein
MDDDKVGPVRRPAHRVWPSTGDSSVDTDNFGFMPDVVSRCVRHHLIDRAGQTRAKHAMDYDDLVKSVSWVWRFLSTAISATLPVDIAVDVEVNHPGYVVVRAGELRVFIPFFVASIFPHGALLAAIGKLAKQIRVGTDSVICISGSACQLGLGVPVADLDFCEYVPQADREVPERLLKKLCEESTEALGFRLTLGEGKDKEWLRPWPDCFSGDGNAAEVSELRNAVLDASFRQCGFVADVSSLGVLEATNVVLLLDYAHREFAEASRSFAAQEVPIAEACWAPRDLGSPLALGEYIVWLIGSASTLCDESKTNPRAVVKAARRTLSATRLLFWKKQADTLSAMLREDAARLAALLDRCQLHAAISTINEPGMQSRSAKLRDSIDRLRGSAAVDADDYSALTAEEARRFSAVRDAARPVIEDILHDLKAALGLDLVDLGSAA